MYEVSPCVRIVDDDAAVLKSLERLLRAAGFNVRAYGSPQDFLHNHDAAQPGCVLLDLSMPGFDGLKVQQALAGIGNSLPVVFMSGASDVPSTVRAMKNGALDFLTKPFDGQALVEAVSAAIERDSSARAERAQRCAVGERVAALTHRERQVMAHVVAGQLNKQIGAELGIAEKTVKVHRSRMMKKMNAGSVAELVMLVRR